MVKDFNYQNVYDLRKSILCAQTETYNGHGVNYNSQGTACHVHRLKCATIKVLITMYQNVNDLSKTIHKTLRHKKFYFVYTIDTETCLLTAHKYTHNTECETIIIKILIKQHKLNNNVT